jgi:hypothetical protein
VYKKQVWPFSVAVGRQKSNWTAPGISIRRHVTSQRVVGAGAPQPVRFPIHRQLH